MHATILATFFEFSRTATSMCAAGVALLLIGLWAAKRDVANARGPAKVVALADLCFAAPLAVFGAEHFSAAQGIMQIVPKFMPWPLFWTYLVGAGLLAASLSIATKVQVQWSGLLFGIMMFLFVAMMDLPGTLANVHNRISWVLLCREMSFGAGGWVLAGGAMQAGRSQAGSKLITVGRVVIGPAAMFYGVEHFLYPINVPGVPLEKLMPAWIPAPHLISYLTGAILLVAGAAILLNKKVPVAATYLGSWIFLLVLLVYGPILIASLLDPSTDVKVEGLNYFFDTLLYAGTILALARATPRPQFPR
ncbi:MAG TPA: hypothetical protein VGS05_14145 [Candidatus Sulfotelmatobacter sp.]|nr:hypothetical protein [Candidatus Sulfotelmatobacter sp.]